MGDNLVLPTDLRQRPGHFWVVWQDEIHREAVRAGVEGDELTEVLRMLGAAQVRDRMGEIILDKTYAVNQLVPAEKPFRPAKRRLAS